MESNGLSIQQELQNRQVKRQAAIRETAPLLKMGWLCLIGAWVFPIIPFLGFFGMALMGMIAVVIAFVSGFKGNFSGAMVLGFSAWLGSGFAAFIWIGIYALVGSLGG